MSTRRLCLIMLVLAWTAPHGSSYQAESGKIGAQEEPLAVDAQGDPLPAGAIARLGTSLGRPHGPLRFLADGKTLLAAGHTEDTIYLRDAFTGKALRRYELNGQRHFFDFSPDGKSAVLVDRSGSAKENTPGYLLWDIVKDKEIAVLRSGVKAIAPIGAVYSPDGSLIATSLENIAVWEARTGKKLYELSLGAKCYHFGFSADSKTLNTGVPLKGLVVNQWDARTGDKIHSLTFKDEKLTSVAFAPDGQLLAVWGLKANSFVADAKSGKELYKPKVGGHRVFAPKGDLLAVHGKGIRFLDARTGKERDGCGEGDIYNFVFSLDGKRIASVASAQTIGLWDVATGRDLHPRKSGQGNQINDIALSTDGKTIHAAGTSHIALWDLDKREQKMRLGEDKVRGGKWTFLAQGRFLGWMKQDGAMQLFGADGMEGDRLAKLGRVVALEAAPEGKTLALLTVPDAKPLGAKLRLRLWDTAAKKELPPAPIKLGDYSDLPSMPGAALAFSPDGKVLAVNDSKDIHLLSLGAEGKPRKLSGRWKRSPFQLRFSPDGRLLAAVSPNECYVWRVESGAEQRLDFVRSPESKLVPEIYRVCFTPDSRMLATGHFRAIRLWELATGGERCELRNGAHGLAFTPDQKLLVSGGYDHAILLWDMNRLVVTDSTAKQKLQPAELESLWTALAATPRPAFVAQQRLSAAPQQAVPFLDERLRRKPLDPQRLTDLLARLEGKTLLGAETAANELTQLGSLAEDRVRAALLGSTNEEVNRHLERILKKIDDSPESLRELRAMETLERAGTVDAQRLLVELAKDLPSLRLRKDAQDASRRLSKHNAFDTK